MTGANQVPQQIILTAAGRDRNETNETNDDERSNETSTNPIAERAIEGHYLKSVLLQIQLFYLTVSLLSGGFVVIIMTLQFIISNSYFHYVLLDRGKGHCRVGQQEGFTQGNLLPGERISQVLAFLLRSVLFGN